MDWIETLTGNVSMDTIFLVVRVVTIIVVGSLTIFLLRKITQRRLAKSFSAQQTMLTQRIISYLLFGIMVTWVLHELGFSLSVLIGAAGILTVALGFASQTSVSNIISGLFLLAEKPFVVGDIIEVDATTGEVLSIDLLSVKMRTFDNLFVRMPNETMLKSKVKTLTRFPIRRLDMRIGIAYKEDISRVRDLLLQVADDNPLCLHTPQPLFIFQGYGESSLDIQFSVWAKRENYLALRNSMYEEIKQVFDANQVEIPFPHRSIYAGSVSEPIPVKVV